MPQANAERIGRKSVASTPHKRSASVGARSRSVKSREGTRSARRRTTGMKSMMSKRNNDPVKNAKYSRLNDEDEGIEMSELDIMKPVAVYRGAKNPDQWIPHEIYERTYYQPNHYIRLLEIPINSSLAFQKALYYHGTFDLIYLILMVPANLYKL